jgi:hypothetical protein
MPRLDGLYLISRAFNEGSFVPRHIIYPKPGRIGNAKLVQDLASEIRQPSGKIMPYILEEEVPATGLRSVTVIWDRWKEVSDEDRADVILAAYESAEGKKYADTIAMPTGLTPIEAHALGYLPFKVESLRHKGDRVTEADYRKALAVEAGRTLLGKHANELRYPRSEEAHDACSRMTKTLPGSQWGVVEELRTE